MMTACWTDWCTKQLADLSTRLMIQGYAPADIEQLRAERLDFRDQFARFEHAFDQIAAEMEAQPQGYHHYDALTRAKSALLQFTNLHRGLLLQPAFKQLKRKTA